MIARYSTFLTDLPIICDRLDLDEDDLSYVDFQSAVGRWLQGNPW